MCFRVPYNFSHILQTSFFFSICIKFNGFGKHFTDFYFKAYDKIREKTIAYAILDDLIHKLHRIELLGEFMM